jgi:hypothetical protein
MTLADSNLQSLVPKTNALSIRPQGQLAGACLIQEPIFKAELRRRVAEIKDNQDFQRGR